MYRLNDDGKWVDKGTGHVSVEYLERLDAVGLVVIDEEDSKTLLIHRISSEEIYQRQEGQSPEHCLDRRHPLTFVASHSTNFVEQVQLRKLLKRRILLQWQSSHRKHRIWVTHLMKNKEIALSYNQVHGERFLFPQGCMPMKLT